MNSKIAWHCFSLFSFDSTHTYFCFPFLLISVNRNEQFQYEEGKKVETFAFKRHRSSDFICFSLRYKKFADKTTAFIFITYLHRYCGRGEHVEAKETYHKRMFNRKIHKFMKRRRRRRRRRDCRIGVGHVHMTMFTKFFHVLNSLLIFALIING